MAVSKERPVWPYLRQIAVTAVRLFYSRLLSIVTDVIIDIRRFLKLGVSKTAIAKLTGVSRTTLYSFLRTRGLKPSP